MGSRDLEEAFVFLVAVQAHPQELWGQSAHQGSACKENVQCTLGVLVVGKGTHTCLEHDGSFTGGWGKEGRCPGVKNQSHHKTLWDQGVCSVGEVLVMQVWWPESRFPETLSTRQAGCLPVVLAPGRLRRICHSELVGGNSPTSKFWGQLRDHAQ